MAQTSNYTGSLSSDMVHYSLSLAVGLLKAGKKCIPPCNQTKPTRCNVTQWYLLLQMLHMFQAVPPPIIRSSKLYTHHRVFVELFLLLTAMVSELELQFQLTHDSGKKQKKLDKYPMLCIKF